MKKNLYFFFVLLFVLVPGVAGAQENFQTLTGLPVFDSIGSGPTGLAGFFNQLYVLAVGAAAIIAVAQIMIAGFRWSTAGGSHSTIEEARDNIQNSVLGLLLVLSPTIVFGVINPKILNLEINTEVFVRPDVTEGGAYALDPDLQTSMANIPRNAWGEIDGACNITFNGDSVGRRASIASLGRGDATLGRACCRLIDGQIDGTMPDVCDLSSLIENDRYALIVKARVAAEVENPEIINGVPQKNVFEVFVRSSGINSELVVDLGLYKQRNVSRDNPMFAIHGFRSEAQCRSVANSPLAIERILKGPPGGAGFIRLYERTFGVSSLHNDDGVAITPALGPTLEVLSVVWSDCERHPFNDI